MGSDTTEGSSWIDAEIDGAGFGDARLSERLRKLMGQLDSSLGQPIPLACEDWANTKAAYRFLANASVNEGPILAGHFRATARRAAGTDGLILVLQDTTEFVYQRASPENIGFTKHVNSGRDKDGRWRQHKLCGVMMHASLAITLDGLPLGLTAARFWTRAQFKGLLALKRKVNQTRVPIETKESFRWLENMRASTSLLGDAARLVHIGDRENDIYEFFCATQELGTHFVVRTCVNRLAGNGKHTVATEMAEVAVAGYHRFEIADGNWAKLALKFKRINVLPPIGKARRYPPLTLTVIHATEVDPPEGRKPIDWKLLTDLPIESAEEAVEKMAWYAMRWKIELFFKILKSGCSAEKLKLRTAERLVNLIAIFCILGWRIFWMTMLNRALPGENPDCALTSAEIDLLDQLAGRGGRNLSTLPTLSAYLCEIARLGGYLARKHDPPPGNMLMWRGWSRLMDIQLGAELASDKCG
jgi:Transposase DNA-binding